MDANAFREQLLPYLSRFNQALADSSGDWVVKGFIDVHRNIYTISIDTKVISKLIELMLFPVIAQFARTQNYQIVPSMHQNHYPDVTFILPDDSKIALDLKSTYRMNSERVNGFTLGAFTGYFRQRSTTKNITFPYEHYDAHFVLGIIYSRTDAIINEQQQYTLTQLALIDSVIKDFEFLLQEKWRIAGTRPGSGNTKNIGSITQSGDLLNGNDPFVLYGEKVFNDYWQNYLTADMARAIDSAVPYRNLDEYLKWRDIST